MLHSCHLCYRCYRHLHGPIVHALSCEERLRWRALQAPSFCCSSDREWSDGSAARRSIEEIK